MSLGAQATQETSATSGETSGLTQAPSWIKSNKKAPGAWAGINAVGKKYLGGGKAGRKALKLGAGLAGATFAGTIGMAAGVASGNFGNIAKYGVGGFAAGYMGGNALATKGINTGMDMQDTFMEASKGSKNWNNDKSDKEFFESTAWSEVLRSYGASTPEQAEELAQYWKVYRDNGITDNTAIKAMLKKKKSAQSGALAIRFANSIGGSWHNHDVRENYKQRIRTANLPYGVDPEEIIEGVNELHFG